MKALFPSDVEFLVLDSFGFYVPIYLFFLLCFFFFSFLKPNMDLCFYSKSCYTEVFIVCDCFEGRRVAVWFHIPYLRLLVLNMVLKTYILVSKTSI